MAEVPVRVSMTVVDEWGIESSSTWYAQADDTKTIAALITEQNLFTAAFDGCTDGYIRAQRLTLLPALPGGVKTSAASGSRVEQTGLLGFSATGTDKRWSGAIPALANGSTVLLGDRIVLTGADPVGLLLAILTTVGTVLKWTNQHNQQIQAFIDALVSFHKKRKQLQRSSFEV